MNTYPTTLPLCPGSGAAVRSGIRNRYASNLAVRPRTISSVEFYDPVAVHNGLTATQFASFKTFYNANRGVQFTYTDIDGTTRTCVFDDSQPFTVAAQPSVGGIVYSLSVRMLQAA